MRCARASDTFSSNRSGTYHATKGGIGRNERTPTFVLSCVCAFAWPCHAALCTAYGLRRRKFRIASSASIRNSYGLVIKLKRIAWQHATAYGRGNGYVEHGGNLECERRFGREFDGGNNIEHWALYRAPGLAELRKCHNPGHEPGEQFSERHRGSDSKQRHQSKCSDKSRRHVVGLSRRNAPTPCHCD